jgi:hypothetical protein
VETIDARLALNVAHRRAIDLLGLAISTYHTWSGLSRRIILRNISPRNSGNVIVGKDAPIASRSAIAIVVE